MAIAYLLLCLWALIVLFPFYWMVLTSRKELRFLQCGIYSEVFHPVSHSAELRGRFYHCFRWEDTCGNTLFFTVVTTAIMLVVITLAAFAFARLNFAGKDLIFTLFLSLMMIPNELVVITNFTTITNLDLRNTFTGLILPSVTSAYFISICCERISHRCRTRCIMPPRWTVLLICDICARS